MTTPAETDVTRMSIIKRNALADPKYCPYCLRCVGNVRMRKIDTLLWQCDCGAVHDEREPPASPPPAAGESAAGCPKPLNILRGHLVELDDYNAMKAELTRTLAAVTSERDKLLEELKLSEYRTNEQIRDKHRILEEYESATATLRQQCDKLQAFKDWVHNWLDKAGVPHDPDAEHNAKSGCRISGRLEWLKARLAAVTAERDNLKEELAASVRQWNDIDLRNEKRHREWSERIDAFQAERDAARSRADTFGSEMLKQASEIERLKDRCRRFDELKADRSEKIAALTIALSRAEAAECDNEVLLRLVDLCNPEVRYALDQTGSLNHQLHLKGLIKEIEEACEVPHPGESIRSRLAALERVAADAIERMDRARAILTKGVPSDSCYWGVLDTSDMKKSLDAAAAGKVVGDA